MSIYTAIQKTVLENMRFQAACELRTGTVVAAAPLKIQLQTGFVLERSSILFPDSLRGRVLVTSDGSYRLDNALSVGDMVLLLCVNGQYLLLDRMGEEDGDRIITAG